MQSLNYQKYYSIYIFCFLLFFTSQPIVAGIPPIPMKKPNETQWRAQSNIEKPASKPDPVIFMSAIPSKISLPITKPNPLSIYPNAKKFLTEMIFERTNILTERENIKSLSLKKNEGLNPLLQRGGFSSNEAYEIIEAVSSIANLKRLPIGLNVQFLTPEENNTGGITFRISKEFNIYAIQDKNKDWMAIKAIRPIKTETLLIQGTINTNLYEAAKAASLPEDVLMELVQLMGYSIDFQRQIQPGDKFKVIFDQSYDILDNKRLGLKKLSFANMVVSGERLSFYRFITQDGVVGYYDENGQSARKAIMKTPINGAKLSSGFGLRKHPIKGFSAIHKGVDFAAPSGTPIFAAGDGVLEKVGWINGYGKYILIRHNSTYKTAYAHLKAWARGIRRGVRVSQGQTIGYVGSTGRSTGPHLHYEILINGKQVNPLGVKMPSGKPIPKVEMMKFKTTIKKMNLDLENYFN